MVPYEEGENPLAIPWPHYCRKCGDEFDMAFYDIMRWTSLLAAMPCGHSWSELDYQREVRSGSAILTAREGPLP